MLILFLLLIYCFELSVLNEFCASYKKLRRNFQLKLQLIVTKNYFCWYHSTRIVWILENNFANDIEQDLFNPLRAKFFTGNIKTYQQFISFLHADMIQVVEILPH